MHLRSVDRRPGGWLLLDPRWMARKLAGPGVAALVDDYSGSEGDLRLVGDALRLSAHVLARDHSQLVGQLLGRLSGSDVRGHRELIAGARAALSRSALLPTVRKSRRSWRAAVAHLRGSCRSDQHRGAAARWDLRPVRLLGRHIEAVRSWQRHSTLHLEGLPRGGGALSASEDGTLKLWDLNREAVPRSPSNHVGSITAVALLPDTSRAITGSRDRTLKLWDLKSRDLLRTLKGHVGTVEAVVVLPEGSRALSASRDGSLKLWNIDSGEVLLTLEGHGGWVNAVTLAHNGRHALSVSADGTLKLWDLEGGAQIAHSRWTYKLGCGCRHSWP